jgi:carbonic anhydrase
MPALPPLLESNRRWSERMRASEPDFFSRLLQQQNPEYLWIGCSDSRVPANQIVGLLPGELFVHRNVANLVHQTDLNCLSVVQFAVEVLGVKHVMIVGHYGCGGVRAALLDKEMGLIDNWIRPIRELYHRHADRFDPGMTEEEQVDRLCEINVMAQVDNLCRTTVMQQAWRHGHDVQVHGWVYRLADGIIHDLQVSRSRADAMEVWHGLGAANGVK